MFVTRCPHCGHPIALSLVSAQQVQCGACGFAGPPPPEDAARLARAAEIVQAANIRERQLGPMQTRLLTSDLVANLLYAAALLACVAPYLCCVWFAVERAQAESDYVTLVASAAPLIIIAIFAASGFFFLRARLRRIRRALMSSPTPDETGRAGCRLCGGPIPVGDVRAVARCSFCEADNLVDPRYLSARERAQDAALDRFEADLAQQATVARQAFRSAMRGLGLGALLAAPLSCCVWAGVYTAAREIDGEPLDEPRYALVRSEGRECIARVTPWRRGRSKVVWTTPSGDYQTAYPDAGVAATFGYQALPGLSLVFYDDPRPATVERVVGYAFAGTNEVVVRYPDHTLVESYPTYACLAPGQPGPAPAFDPPAH